MLLLCLPASRLLLIYSRCPMRYTLTNKLRFAIAMQSACFLFSRAGGEEGCGEWGRPLTSKPTTRLVERAGKKRGAEGGKQTSKIKPFSPISLDRLSSKQTKTVGTLLHSGLLGFFSVLFSWLNGGKGIGQQCK